MAEVLDEWSTEQEKRIIKDFEALRERRSSIDTRTALKPFVVGSPVRWLKIVLTRSHSPSELYRSLDIADETNEFLCFKTGVGYVERSLEEDRYRKVPQLAAWPILLAEEQDKMRTKHQIRPFISMEMKALHFLTICLTVLGLPHHWILTPLSHNSSTTFEPISQSSLCKSQMTLAQLARLLREKSCEKLVVSIEPTYTIGANIPSVPAMVFKMVLRVPADAHPNYSPDPRPSCCLTAELLVVGAHLVDWKFKSEYPRVINALTVAFADTPSQPCLEDFFAPLRRALQDLNSSDLTDMPSDVVPLDPTAHDHFDRAHLFISPFGGGEWFWTSNQSIPMALLWGLAGSSQGKEPPSPESKKQEGKGQKKGKSRGKGKGKGKGKEPEQESTEAGPSLKTKNPPSSSGVRKMLQADPNLAGPMLASACKVILASSGSEELQNCYKRLAARHLRQAEFPRKPRSTPSKRSAEDDGSGPPSSRPRTPRTASGSSPRSFRATRTPGGGSSRPRTPAARSSPAPSPRRRQGPVEASSSSFRGLGSTLVGSSDPREVATSLTALSSDPPGQEKEDVELRESVAQLVSAVEQDAPAREEVIEEEAEEDQAREEEEEERLDFDQLWIETLGRVGTTQERQAALILEKVGNATLARQNVEPLGPRESFQRVANIQRLDVLDVEEYEALGIVGEREGLATCLREVGNDEKYQELLRDRFASMFYTAFPAVLGRQMLQ